MSINTHQLMAWLSPSFPTGAFAYSHGLEYAIFNEQITDAASLEAWLTILLEQGSAWNDAVLLCHAYRGIEVEDLAEALAGSKERLQETRDLGTNFARAASQLLPEPIADAPLPVVTGKAAAIVGINLADLLPLYLHSLTANLVSAAIRLVPLGQIEGQTCLQNLFVLFNVVAERARGAKLDDLGNAAFAADIAAMRHEDMKTRIFRT